MLRYIKLEQFTGNYELNKRQQPDTKKPIHKPLHLPIDAAPIITEAIHPKAHSVLHVGPQQFTVKGYPDTVKRQLEEASQDAYVKDAVDQVKLQPTIDKKIEAAAKAVKK